MHIEKLLSRVAARSAELGLEAPGRMMSVEAQLVAAD